MTSIEAKLKACRPEAHIRFTLVPGTVSGKPAIKGAIRPMLRPCSSICVTHPITTSSTIFGWIPARSTRALKAKAASSSTRTSLGASVIVSGFAPERRRTTVTSSSTSTEPLVPNTWTRQ